MFKFSDSSPVDFARLAEETDRLAEHVALVRKRMADAAKRREKREQMGFHLVVSDPLVAEDTRCAEAAPSSSGAARARPVSGVFPVMRDRDLSRSPPSERRDGQGEGIASGAPTLVGRKIPA